MLPVKDIDKNDFKRRNLITVNGNQIDLGDTTPIGRQVISAADFHPVDEYMLLQLLDNGRLEEINSDEPVKLNSHGSTEFFAFKADRLFYFLLEDRKYPWGGDVPENLLRKLGKVGDNKDIWLERKNEADEKIELGSSISLTGDGVERFYSAPRRDNGPYNIIVNGRKKIVEEREMSYASVVRLAFPEGPCSEAIVYTVTFSDPHTGAEGSLVEGTTVYIKNGMIFNVSKTDRS